MKRSLISGFTLVELLIVVAVIAVLAALLMTGFSQVRSRARRTQCLSNLHQLGLALQSFKTDKGYYPPGFDLSLEPGERSWMNALAGQMNTVYNWSTPQGVWHCPAAFEPADWPKPKFGGAWVYNDYGYNSAGLGSLGLTSRNKSMPYVSESQVVNPSEMMAIGDAIEGSPTRMLDGQSFRRASEQRIQMRVTDQLFDLASSTRRVRARHQGLANVVFCDGHVESPTLVFLFTDTSDAALRRWNRDNQPHRELLSL